MDNNQSIQSATPCNYNDRSIIKTGLLIQFSSDTKRAIVIDENGWVNNIDSRHVRIDQTQSIDSAKMYEQDHCEAVKEILNQSNQSNLTTDEIAIILALPKSLVEYKIKEGHITDTTLNAVKEYIENNGLDLHHFNQSN